MSEASLHKELRRIPKLAPDFPKRLKLHREHILEVQSEPGGELSYWPYNSGVYINNPLAEDASREQKLVNEIELTGAEPGIYRFLLEVVSLRGRNAEEGPSIALDWGGGFGISWIKLAKALEPLVKEEKLALVVTNLAVNPGLLTKEQVEAARIDRDDDRYKDLFMKDRHLVHFVELESQGLRGKQIILPKRGRVQLFGNIDLIHEQATLGNSRIPDFDLAELGAALSPYGVMLLDSNDGNTKARELEALKVGQESLRKRGLMKVLLPNDKSYQLFSAPRAPSYVGLR
jgi:hypothetical protein